MRVLLVDDENDTRLISRFSLSRIGGMEVLEAENGRTAIARAAADSPDVILLDVMMPGLDGPSTLLALQENPRTAEIPVIFLTAKVLKGEIDRLRGLGVAGVLMKPFDPMLLPSQVRELVPASPF